MVTINDLPRDESGFIDTSANFGECWMVKIEWSTDADGAPVTDETAPESVTFHGPFWTVDEAQGWMNAYPDDTDIAEMDAVCVNKVRP